MIYCFKGSTKDINFNYFIDAETPFNDIKLKRKRSEDVEENQMKFKSKLSNKGVGGNKSDEKLSK